MNPCESSLAWPVTPPKRVKATDLTLERSLFQDERPIVERLLDRYERRGQHFTVRVLAS